MYRISIQCGITYEKSKLKSKNLKFQTWKTKSQLLKKKQQSFCKEIFHDFFLFFIKKALWSIKEVSNKLWKLIKFIEAL
jgi:hypothetical protein